MARKQGELPGTRRADEPAEQKSIPKLDEALENWEKAKGKVTRATQIAKAARDTAQQLLMEHDLPSYVYEDLAGVEKRFFRKETVSSSKVKKEKRTAPEDDDGDDA